MYTIYIYIYIYHHHHLPIVSHSMTGAPAVFPSSTFDLHQPDTNLAPGHQFFIVICESSLGLPWSPVILCVFGCRAYLGYPGKKRNIHGFNIKLWSYQRADLVRTYGFITIDSNHGQEIRLFFLALTKKTKTPQLMSRKSNAWSKQEVERCLICLCQRWRSISQSGLNGTNVTSHGLLPQFGTQKKHGLVTIG